MNKLFLSKKNIEENVQLALVYVYVCVWDLMFY